jgi:hypothetical protein
VELIARSSPWQQVLTGVLGVAAAVVALLVGDQDWLDALAFSAGGAVGAGAVVVLGGTPLQRGMGRVERVLPAAAVQVRPARGEWTSAVLVHGAIFAWFGLWHRDFAFVATLMMVLTLLFALEGWRVSRWERREGGRLALVPRVPSLRLRHPFRTPEYVLVLDAAGGSRSA